MPGGCASCRGAVAPCGRNPQNKDGRTTNPEDDPEEQSWEPGDRFKKGLIPWKEADLRSMGGSGSRKQTRSQPQRPPACGRPRSQLKGGWPQAEADPGEQTRSQAQDRRPAAARDHQLKGRGGWAEVGRPKQRRSWVQDRGPAARLGTQKKPIKHTFSTGDSPKISNRIISPNSLLWRFPVSLRILNELSTGEGAGRRLGALNKDDPGCKTAGLRPAWELRKSP